MAWAGNDTIADDAMALDSVLTVVSATDGSELTYYVDLVVTNVANALTEETSEVMKLR